MLQLRLSIALRLSRDDSSLRRRDKRISFIHTLLVGIAKADPRRLFVGAAAALNKSWLAVAEFAVIDMTVKSTVARRADH